MFRPQHTELTSKTHKDLHLTFGCSWKAMFQKHSFLFVCFSSRFLHHALSSISLCSLQHRHTALKSMGSYGTLTERCIMCPLDPLFSCWWHHKLKLSQARISYSFTGAYWWISAVLGITHKMKTHMQRERGYSQIHRIFMAWGRQAVKWKIFRNRLS